MGLPDDLVVLVQLFGLFFLAGLVVGLPLLLLKLLWQHRRVVAEAWARRIYAMIEQPSPTARMRETAQRYEELGRIFAALDEPGLASLMYVQAAWIDGERALVEPAPRPPFPPVCARCGSLSDWVSSVNSGPWLCPACRSRCLTCDDTGVHTVNSNGRFAAVRCPRCGGK